VKNPERDPYKYGQMIFSEGTRAILWRKEGLFNQLVLEQRASGVERKRILKQSTSSSMSYYSQKLI